MTAVPAYIKQTPRSAAAHFTIEPAGGWPIGDLWHAREALIYAMAPIHAGKRRKVLRAVAKAWPQYDWATWWNAQVDDLPAVKAWSSYDDSEEDSDDDSAAANPGPQGHHWMETLSRNGRLQETILWDSLEDFWEHISKYDKSPGNEQARRHWWMSENHARTFWKDAAGNRWTARFSRRAGPKTRKARANPHSREWIIVPDVRWGTTSKIKQLARAFVEWGLATSYQVRKTTEGTEKAIALTLTGIPVTRVKEESLYPDGTLYVPSRFWGRGNVKTIEGYLGQYGRLVGSYSSPTHAKRNTRGKMKRQRQRAANRDEWKGRFDDEAAAQAKDLFFTGLPLHEVRSLLPLFRRAWTLDKLEKVVPPDQYEDRLWGAIDRVRELQGIAAKPPGPVVEGVTAAMLEPLRALQVHNGKGQLVVTIQWHTDSARVLDGTLVVLVRVVSWVYDNGRRYVDTIKEADLFLWPVKTPTRKIRSVLEGFEIALNDIAPRARSLGDSLMPSDLSKHLPGLLALKTAQTSEDYAKAWLVRSRLGGTFG